MAYKSLQDFIDVLDKQGELVRIKTEVDPILEVSEINDRIIKNGGKALLFENVKGSEFPVLINAMGSKRRIELTLGVDDIDEIGARIFSLFDTITTPKRSIMDKLKMLPMIKEVKNWAPSRSSSKGICQANVMKEVDLDKLPILTTWPHDGGPFITFPVVHTISENSGMHNMGMYRMQQFDKKTTGMHWHLHKGGANHYNDYKAAGKKMPVTVTLGGDPAYTYAATAPLPPEIDEYMLAGFLRQKSVKLVKSISNDIYIPEDVDFVLEGYVDPSEKLALEGPFGDHTGYYSLADMYPNFHITHITYRNNPVFPATVVGIAPQEDAFIGLATEKMFLAPLKMVMVPEITDMHMPMEGVFHNIMLNTINKKFPGQTMKVMSALWGAGQMMFNKYITVFDTGIEITNYKEAITEFVKNTHPIDDVLFSRGPMDVLDHASEKFAVGGKMGFDATKKDVFDNPKPEVWLEQISKIENVLEVDTNFVNQGLGLLLIRVKKSKNITRKVAKEILHNDMCKDIKFVAFIEEVAILTDYGDVIWRLANNSDPSRDCFYIYDNETSKALPTLFIDGLRKDKPADDFNRDWPNIVTMDEATIKMVDEKWNEYGLGKFLESPSVKYRKQLYKGGAIAE